MKKLLVLVFAIALCLGVLCVGASADIQPTKPAVGDGTEESPYQISTAAELFWFAAQVNDEGKTDIDAVLTADITINKNVLDAVANNNTTNLTQWTPIGTVQKQYTGAFDGQGHTISGLYYSGSDGYAGLFGFVGSDGRVQNIKVTDSYISNSEGIGRTGGVCGCNRGTITNCSFSGSVTGTGWFIDVGGVCGANLGTIENCRNSGSVTGSGTNVFCLCVGGVCGENGNTTTGYATITNCCNTGAVTGSGTGVQYLYVGGVCGYNFDGTITNCYWLTGTASTGIGDDGGTVANVEVKSAEQFASGEVAWLLNSSTNGPWRQTLGEGGDGFPTLDSTHGEIVQLTVKVSGESDTYYYLNSGDKFKGEDGKVYYDSNGKRVEVPCEVTADTTLTSKTLVTVTAASFDCFVGDDKPTLTYTTSPVVEELNVTLECDANMYAVGEYAITISGPETDDSYDFDYVNGVLRVRDSCVVTVDGEVHYVHPGGSFTIPEAPKNGGYIFLGWRCGDETYKAGETIKVTSDMTFTAVWGNLPDVDPEEPEPEPELPFYDVAKGDWFYDAVKYVYYADLMDGVEEHIFAPNDTLTRAMVWTIIARAEGVDTDGGATWYAKAQEWVVAKGISDGENPSAAITRQELVTMLWRLAGEPALGSGISAPDAASVSSWAQQAMSWAVYIGLIEGDENGAVTPAATATRAQAAAIFMRYLEA